MNIGIYTGRLLAFQFGLGQSAKEFTDWGISRDHTVPLFKYSLKYLKLFAN